MVGASSKGLSSFPEDSAQTQQRTLGGPSCRHTHPHTGTASGCKDRAALPKRVVSELGDWRAGQVRQDSQAAGHTRCWAPLSSLPSLCAQLQMLGRDHGTCQQESGSTLGQLSLGELFFFLTC